MPITQIIKFASIIVTSLAIILELLLIFSWLNNANFLPINIIIIWLAHVAIFSHFIEGIIAFWYIKSKNIIDKNPLKYGIYTFFTGTLSLTELFDINKNI
jgi:hypothetical protein